LIVSLKDNHLSLLGFLVKQFVKMASLEETSPEATPSSIKSQFPLPEPSDLVQASSLNFDDMEADMKKIEQSVKGLQPFIIKQTQIVPQSMTAIILKLQIIFSDCELRVAKVVKDSAEEALEPFQSTMTNFLARGLF
jgi:hypothetical protein